MNSSTPRSSPSSNPSDQQGGERHPPATRRTFISRTTPNDPRGASPTTTNIESRRRSSPGAITENYPGSMERGSGEHGVEPSSPSISSSQGDMADTEMDAGPSQSSDAPPPTSSPPKKKRTRTLTTPHQSAVLHALLAQSRFPTTAMREEVGRSIGLSARKVQIWFQNQRQKARRPRGQPTAPLTRPPQFGPFPTALPGMSSSESTAFPGAFVQRDILLPPSASMLRRGELSSSALQYNENQETRMSRPYPPSMNPSYLSGPGIPGASSSTRTENMVTEDGRSATASGDIPRSTAGHVGVDYTPSHKRSRPTSADDSLEAARASHMSSRRLRPLSVGSREQQRDPPIILPPILGDRPRELGDMGAGITMPPLASVHNRRRWPLMEHSESPFSHQAPISIPPPFTLQPRPQWDDPAFSPFTRPGSSSLSRPSSSYSIASGGGYDHTSTERTAPPPVANFPPISNRVSLQQGGKVPHVSPITLPSWTPSHRPESATAEGHPLEFPTPRSRTRSFDDDTVTK